MSISSGKIKRRGVQLCCFFLILAGGLFQLRFAVQEQLVSVGRAGSLIHQRDPRLLTNMAKEKHLFEADMVGAKSLLQRALASNPFYVPAWLSLAELHNDIGNKLRATKILMYVDSLTRELKKWRWEKTLVAYQLGREEMLPGELRYIVGEIPGKDRWAALQLAFNIWEEPETLLQQVGYKNLVHLFNYTIQRKMPQKALFFFRILESRPELWDEKQVVTFLDMLLREGEIGEAGAIWRRHFNPDKILYNGNFAQPLMQRAFGWRKGKDLGYELRFEKDRESESGQHLYYRFKGWENINFYHLSQIVPVDGGKKYWLQAEIKTQRLTTNQRPFLEVYGYKCEMTPAASDMVAPDQNWMVVDVTFSVPEECQAVVVRLRRKESRHIDNKLAGKMWVKKFSVSRVANDVIIRENFPE